MKSIQRLIGNILGADNVIPSPNPFIYPSADDTVIILDDEKFMGKHIPLRTLGVIDGMREGMFKDGQGVNITFNADVYRDEKYVSCSGGPGTILTPVECLVETGLCVRLRCWSKVHGMATKMSHDSRHYFIWSNLWVWKYQPEELLARKFELTAAQYRNETSKFVDRKLVEPCDGDWERDEHGVSTGVYRVQTGCVVDGSSIFYSNETAVGMVYWKEKSDRIGVSRPTRYFKQLRHLYSKNFSKFSTSNELCFKLHSERLISRNYFQRKGGNRNVVVGL